MLLFGSVAIAGNDKEPAAPAVKSTLQGKVTDFLTDEELAGVTVQIEGTSIKAYTDIEGNFRIEGVEPGNYNLTVSYISYKEMKLQDILAASPVDIKLEQKN
ncbi:MAG: carboxypeptidase-like regulatory domain-containing protein [Bacteroidales bacterium]|nr:carboxypeptidase-like regulatory domain-containing protein [Bacteroidales bacterium]